MTSPTVDVARLADELLAILGPPVNAEDRLDNILGPEGHRLVGRRDERLKEWFLGRSFAHQIAEPIVEELNAREARQLCQLAHVPGCDQRVRRTGEYIERWLLHHHIRRIRRVTPLFSPANEMQELSAKYRLSTGRSEEINNICASARKYVERLLKELLAYTWGLLAPRCSEALSLLRDHCVRHSEFYHDRIACDCVETLIPSFASCNLTSEPLCGLSDKLCHVASQVDVVKVALSTYISAGWALEAEEIQTLRRLGQDCNPQLHDRPGHTFQFEEFSSLLNSVARVFEEWGRRGLLPRIAFFHECRKNQWGTFLHALDLSKWNGQQSSPIPERRLFIGDRDPTPYLNHALYVYIADNPLSAGFEACPRPVEFEEDL
jgi:hypothetical protein